MLYAAAGTDTRKGLPFRDVRQTLRWWARCHARKLPCLRLPPELEDEDGAGVRVALLDGGVAWTHPVFDGAHLYGRDFTRSIGLADSTGHGSRNAALLVGQNPHYVRGLAPACELLVAKVLPCWGRLKGDEVVARAINWATDQCADVIVIPLGRRFGTRSVVLALQKALNVGCSLYAAAGNRGPEVLAFPASMHGVIAVSALDTGGRPLSWCCQSTKVGCYAPGEVIWSLGDTPMSGTSPATVIAAGVAILKLARQRRREKENEGRQCLL